MLEAYRDNAEAWSHQHVQLPKLAAMRPFHVHSHRSRSFPPGEWAVFRWVRVTRAPSGSHTEPGGRVQHHRPHVQSGPDRHSHVGDRR